MSAALRRPSRSPLVRRVLLLSGLATGLWLAGSAGSSAAADEPAPQPLAPIAAPVQDLAGGLLSPVTTAVTPVVPPVVQATVAPLVQTLAPVGEVLTPVVRAAQPVTAPVVAVLSPVLSPVLQPVVAPVWPVLEPVLEPVLRPVAVLAPVRAVPAEPAATVDSPSALDAPVLVPMSGEIAGSAAASVPTATTAGSDTRTGVVVAQPTGPSLDAPAPVPGGRNVPVPGPALPSGAPAPAVASGPSSSDQHAADLPPAATAVGLVALGAAGDDARDAAADRALDPSFAPD